MSRNLSLWHTNPISERRTFRDFLNLQEQAERLFSQWEGLMPSIMESPAFPSSTFDVEETGSHYLMSFDLPGVKKEDIKIDLREGELRISGERKKESGPEESSKAESTKAETKGKNKSRYYSESVYGSFERIFSLPPGVKSEQIEAAYSDGVLRISIPKGTATNGYQVKIGEGKPGAWSRLFSHPKGEDKAEIEKKSAA